MKYFTALALCSIAVPGFALETVATAPFQYTATPQVRVPACTPNQVVGVSGTAFVCKDMPAPTQLLEGWPNVLKCPAEYVYAGNTNGVRFYDIIGHNGGLVTYMSRPMGITIRYVKATKAYRDHEPKDEQMRFLVNPVPNLHPDFCPGKSIQELIERGQTA